MKISKSIRVPGPTLAFDRLASAMVSAFMPRNPGNAEGARTFRARRTRCWTKFALGALFTGAEQRSGDQAARVKTGRRAD